MTVEPDPVSEKQTDSNDVTVAGGGRRLKWNELEMMAVTLLWFVVVVELRAIVGWCGMRLIYTDEPIWYTAWESDKALADYRHLTIGR